MFCFIVVVYLQIRHFVGLYCQLVATFVFGMVGVTFDPNQFYLMLAENR